MIGLTGLGYATEFLVPIVLAVLLAMVSGPVRRFFDRGGVPATDVAITSIEGQIAAGGGPGVDPIARKGATRRHHLETHR